MELIISIVAVVISVIVFIHSLVTNTKRYELTTAQRTDLLDWFHKTLEQLVLAREKLEANLDFDKTIALAKLSSLIECGRFFFPNMANGKGKNKPTAYQGSRDVILDFLVFSYDLIKRDDAKEYITHLHHLQRLFSSRIFEIISPRKYNKLVNRHTTIILNKPYTSEDFIASGQEFFVTRTISSK
ncbi:MAG: hypothetical protein FWC71_08915 [Defluviitaleaceae bacterium]|nr:hypothetical protein [Defluviitaleaceae bacterium]